MVFQYALASAIPPLPILPGIPCPADIITAHQQLQKAFSSSLAALRLDECDPTRLGHCYQHAKTFMLPLLKAMASQDDFPLPLRYVQLLREAVVGLMERLEDSHQRSLKSESLNVIPVAVVSTRKEGRRCGRPQKTISREFLSEAFRPGRNISLSKVAEAIGVDRKTLSAQMKIQGIVRTPFSTISDENLDVLVKDHKTKHPNAGIRYIRGSLHAKNLRVQRHRVISSLSRVDTVTVVSHRNMEIMRRDYHNPHPNAMWHLDGHHKLGPWGIVIHGITDGYDRVITGMQPSTENTAQRVLQVFLKAVNRWGCPSRSRGDRGSENVDVSTWMIITRGANRGSFIWGTSTHNTRIERLWLEVGRCFARGWRAFFTRLGQLYRLEKENSHHLWLLHYLFFPDIKEDCVKFQENWNRHPISGKGKNLSPMDLRLLGQAKYGVYNDTSGGPIDPRSLAEYYGGCSHTDNPMNSHIAKVISEAQRRQVRHDVAEVADSRSPFNEHELQMFARQLSSDLASHSYPAGYNLNDQYHSIESYTTGRSSKPLVIPLPYEIWFPRIVVWCKALDLLNRIQLCKGTT